MKQADLQHIVTLDKEDTLYVDKIRALLQILLPNEQCFLDSLPIVKWNEIENVVSVYLLCKQRANVVGFSMK
jgi:hypothetical protein